MRLSIFDLRVLLRYCGLLLLASLWLASMTYLTITSVDTSGEANSPAYLIAAAGMVDDEVDGDLPEPEADPFSADLTLDDHGEHVGHNLMLPPLPHSVSSFIAPSGSPIRVNAFLHRPPILC
eukprot:TRINITY_DN12810_c0_g1_i2.p1 TRINITY_DN12810_c0_g1~~TRINITY_DN12810_c0_g1_i2.p1  ORF type:complete len:122 (+),score=29.85 TRINITY_DN12810_c0_g1_i2:108-473(+)